MMRFFLLQLLFINILCAGLTAQTYKGDLITSTLKTPEKIIRVGDGHYFIDFGKDAFGTLVLSFGSQPNDTLILHLGEKAVNSTKLDRRPGGSIRYQKLMLTDIPLRENYVVNLPADKRNTGPDAVVLPDSMGVIMPFRYCEIENLNIPISDITIRQRVYNYRFNNEKSAFVSSDTLLNQIWDMCKYTIKATSFAGIYIDGDRERIPYEADAYINQLSHYCVDDEYSIGQNTNEYFIAHPTWPTEWVLHTVPLFYYDYLYTGNTSFLSKHYEALEKRTLIDLKREDGLISVKSPALNEDFLKSINAKQDLKDIVDWPKAERDGYEMVNVNTVVNAFHYRNLKLMAEIAGCLGKEQDSVYFHQQSLVVKKSINEKLFDPVKGLYVDGENSSHSSLHANMFSLAFGVVPDENVKTVIEFVKSRGMACSVYGAQYLLEAMYKYGEEDYALSLLVAKHERSWWNMIQAGSTIALEAWDIKHKPNLDWNHAWGAAPANIVTRHMWGISPAKPGFSNVKIRPQLSRLQYSSIKVPTIKGAILADYKLNNDKSKLYVVRLPEGMKGEFVLPSENLEVKFNRRKVKSTGKVLLLSPGINRIQVTE